MSKSQFVKTGYETVYKIERVKAASSIYGCCRPHFLFNVQTVGWISLDLSGQQTGRC